MKHSAIAGLFVTAAMLASPVFAADKDLCTSNIQQIKQVLDSEPTTSESAKDNIKASLKRAEDAQKAGDDKACISETTKTLEKIQTRNPADKG
ncbi:tmRNA [Pseudomonas syringae]|uniref:TmRNA n=1 Tax=Pseudomonas syringae TaxID=317 RepID=A0A0L1MNW1_PSESX|nr:tmRNA [Pseudomonas syringae]